MGCHNRVRRKRDLGLDLVTNATGAVLSPCALVLHRMCLYFLLVSDKKKDKRVVTKRYWKRTDLGLFRKGF